MKILKLCLKPLYWLAVAMRYALVLVMTWLAPFVVLILLGVGGLAFVGGLLLLVLFWHTNVHPYIGAFALSFASMLAWFLWLGLAAIVNPDLI